MSNVSVSQSTRIQVQHTEIRVQERVAPPSEQMGAQTQIPQDHLETSAPVGLAQPEIKLPEESKPTKGSTMLKNIVGGTLVGGAAAATLNMTARSMVYNAFKKPTAAWTGAGAVLGAGIALKNIETDNAGVNGAKDMLANGMMAGGGAALASSVGRSMIQPATSNYAIKYLGATPQLFGPSVTTTAAAAAIGVSAAALSMDTGSETGNLAKDMVAGGVMGGAIMTIGSSLLKATTYSSAAAAAMAKPSPTAIALGVAAGAGIALLNSGGDE